MSVQLVSNMRFFKGADFFTALTKWVQIRTNISEAKSDKIGSLLLSKHLIVRGRKRRGLGEIKFDASVIRTVPFF